MTMGPYHATGSSSGLPDTKRKRIPSSPACTVTSSPRSKSTSERFSCVSWRLGVRPSHAFGRHGEWPGSVAELPIASEDVGERVPSGLDRERLAFARRDRHIEIDRIGSDAVDRARLSPEISADDANVGAIVVGHFGDVARLHFLVARRRSSSALTEDSPTAEIHACVRWRRPSASPGG